MNSLEELKELNIAFPDEADITGYNGIYNRYVKRVIDFVFALLFFIILLPVFAVVSLLIYTDDGSPVFYRAQRGGYKNKTFRIFKFRTMVKNADKIGGGTTALGDSRITKSGALLRKTKLDEIPNLINILRGEMSFVGPRPELLLYTTQYTKEQECIMWVRPGITDRSSIVYIAQDEIVGEEDPVANFERLILPEKNRLRVEYAKTQSFGLDCRLILETLAGVFGKAEDMAKEKKQKG